MRRAGLSASAELLVQQLPQVPKYCGNSFYFVFSTAVIVDGSVTLMTDEWSSAYDLRGSTDVAAYKQSA